MHHQQDALQPTFALLQEVQQRERRLLVHLALNPVERITFAERFHGEEAIFGYGAVGAVVKRNFALGVELEEKKFVKIEVFKDFCRKKENKMFGKSPAR